MKGLRGEARAAGVVEEEGGEEGDFVGEVEKGGWGKEVLQAGDERGGAAEEGDEGGEVVGDEAEGC